MLPEEICGHETQAPEISATMKEQFFYRQYLGGQKRIDKMYCKLARTNTSTDNEIKVGRLYLITFRFLRQTRSDENLNWYRSLCEPPEFDSFILSVNFWRGCLIYVFERSKQNANHPPQHHFFFSGIHGRTPSNPTDDIFRPSSNVGRRLGPQEARVIRWILNTSSRLVIWRSNWLSDGKTDG